MKFTPIVFLLLAGLSLLPMAKPTSQSIAIQNQVIEDLCRYDPGITVTQSATHFFYQTQNNKFDGPIDSSFCANFSIEDGPYFLDLADYDFDKVLFVAQNLDDATPPNLLPYSNYLLQQFFWLDDVELDQDSTATDSIFSGFRVGYLFQDEVTGISGERETVFSFDNQTSSPYPEEIGSICFYTERFEQQQLTHVVAAFKLMPTGPAPRLTPYDLGLQPSFEQGSAVSHLEIFAPGVATGPFESDLFSSIRTVEPGANYPFHLQQQDTILPGQQNFRFTDVNLVSDATGQQDLTIFMDFQSIFYQPPFTALRGGLVTGQDSVRHNLTLAVQEPFFADCFYNIIERKVPTGVTYHFTNVPVEFGDPNACFMLEPGGGIIVAANSRLDYGKRGVGLLASKKDSRIEVERSATFAINVPWILAQNPFSGEEEDTHIYLNQDAVLAFGNQASLERSHPDGRGYLYVHLAEGATINGQYLSPDEWSLIRLVEPTPPAIPANKDLRLFPNPANTDITIDIPTEIDPNTATVILVNGLGQVILTSEVASLPGSDRRVLNLPQYLNSGWYQLRLIDAKEVYKSVVIIR